MSEEQGESVETPDDEPGDSVDEPGDVDDEPGDAVDEPGDTNDASAGPGSQDEPDAAEERDGDGSEASIDLEALEDLVEAHETEAVARELGGLRERVRELERELEAERTEREELESRLKRKQAEFQNYKKRQSRRREQERARATEDLVERLLEVRDNLGRALEQDDDADIREGVEATFRQLDDVLRGENVDPIEPEPGAEVDPQRHEVLLKVDGDQPPGTVEEVHRPGYEMGDKVLRTARVTVADGDASSADSDPEAESGSGAESGSEFESGSGAESGADDGPPDGADADEEESLGDLEGDADTVDLDGAADTDTETDTETDGVNT